jgi:hypothetical protein
MTYPDRIDFGNGYQAWVARFCGIGGRTVILFKTGTDEEVRRFKSHGNRNIGIENARACARAMEVMG